MVHADIPAAKKAQEAMADGVDNMRAALNKIDADVHAVSAARWQGAAHDAFQSVATEWGEQSRKIHAALDSITEQVGHGNKQFEAMEIDNHQEFKHLMGLS